MPKNLSWLAGLRALACLSVVVYHLNQQRSIENLSDWNWDLYQFVETWPVTVSFFFVLWGLLRSAPYWRTILSGDPAPEPRKALIDRFLRIAPAYYVAFAVTIVAVFLVQWGMENALARIFAGFAFLSWIHPSTFFPADFNGPLWYIAFDMTGGLLVVAIMGTLVKLKPKWAVPGLAAAAGILLLAHFAFMKIPFPPGHGPTAEWFPTYNPFLFWLHFLLGMAAWGVAIRMEKEGVRPSHWFDFAFLASFFWAFAFLWHIREAQDFAYSWPNGPYRFPLVPLLLAMALVTVAYTKKVGKWLDNRPFKWIAGLSYSVYLYHALVIALLRHFVFPGHSVGYPEWWALVALSFPLSFAIAHLSNKHVEMKAVIWYRNRQEKKP